MTSLDSLPVDNFDLSDTEKQLAQILFTDADSSQEEIVVVSKDNDDVEPCKGHASKLWWWTLILDILLILTGILMFETALWTQFLPNTIPSRVTVFIKLLVIISFIICIKKFLFP
jgi:cytochrome b subunit of formate dehydrogenase